MSLNAQDRIKLTIGSLIVDNELAKDQIADLKQKVADFEKVAADAAEAATDSSD